jgi:hypothetical protein
MLDLTAVLGGVVLGRVELIGVSRLRIGRARDNDLVLPVKAVSRWHAEVSGSVGDDGRERWVIRDCGSRHGVWAEGVLVHEAVLTAGSSLALGPVTVSVGDLGVRIGEELAGWLAAGGVVAGSRGVGGRADGLSSTGSMPGAVAGRAGGGRRRAG